MAYRCLQNKAVPVRVGSPYLDGIVLQRFCNLSDDQEDFPIRIRYSFYRLLGLSQKGSVPDSKTSREFRGRFKKPELVVKLFTKLLTQIDTCRSYRPQGPE
ncbi:MAG: transposase [Candidatus Thiodiazotropha endolucinida]